MLACRNKNKADEAVKEIMKDRVKRKIKSSENIKLKFNFRKM